MLGNAFGPEDEGNPRVWVDKKGTAHTVLPSEGAYQNNAACVGGGTLSYGAQAWRYMPQDFRMRSTYGAPAGSSLEDWPITYDDLEPFYEKAEYEIGVSGDYSGTPFHGPRRRDLAHAAAAAESRIRDPRARGKAPRPASLSSAHAAQQRSLQRPRSLHALPLVLRIRLRSGRQERLAEHRDSRRPQHGNCELRTECMAKEILTDDRGRATRRRLLRRARPSAGAARRHRHRLFGCASNPRACC